MSSSEQSAQRPSSPTEPSALITFSVKSSNDTKYTLELAPTTSVADLKTKLAELSNIAADRQRLIYSGRVMRDEETLATYKLQSGHTIHMVKGAASNTARGGASSSGPSTGGADARPTVPTNIAAGTGNNPLAGLTGARYAGHVQLPNADVFGPDGGMGPPPDAEALAQAMNNPQFQSTMNDLLSNPQIMDYLFASNPMLAQLGPEVRQIMQSDMFRQMMSNPQLIRSMSQMSSVGLGRGFGGMGGAPSFPEPGRTDTTPASDSQAGSTPAESTPNSAAAAGSTPPLNPFLPGAAGGNPFAALFGGQPPRAGAPGATPGQTPGQAPGQTPSGGFGLDPNTLNSILGGMGGGAGGQPSGATGGAGNLPIPPDHPFANPNNPLGALLGANGSLGAMGALRAAQAQAAASAPVDNRPPEERYADQLRQLNDMGFYDFDRNVAALRRSGGSVQGAINELLGG
ncbi:ubiquitin-domain-containing protein [Choiromyces venosus 120613-1]|uniref:Ubiquitin-domain-containing protein n=1 Tax=Choiromyces venosus 120613-1 TaxID=1336337 RepID=A0A3N4JLC5_9PEZI|nr:ubiquitin-domain-containing protein [Choiromyces venosus 120613-1]